jgi:hypothetical protein
LFFYICFLIPTLSIYLVVPPANLQSQTYNYPQVALPSTPGIKPQYNVPLADGAENIVDLTFGTNVEGATITSVAEVCKKKREYEIIIKGEGRAKMLKSLSETAW